MNELEVLRGRIFSRFPDAQADEQPLDDPPANPDGSWFLDVRLGDRRITIEWRPKKGYGVSDTSKPKDIAYGEGPEVVYSDQDSAFQGIVDLLGS